MRIKALEKLFFDYQKQLYILALSITKDPSSAEDVVHDALIAVAEIGSEPENLKAYLFRVVRNKALHYSRKAQQELPYDFEYLVDESDYLEGDNFVKNVYSAIETLKQGQQKIIIMKVFGDLTFAEIASLTEMSQNTVASHYRRGIKILQEKLDESI